MNHDSSTAVHVIYCNIVKLTFCTFECPDSFTNELITRVVPKAGFYCADYRSERYQ